MTLWYLVQFWPRISKQQSSELIALVVLEVVCGLIFCFFAAVMVRNAIRIYKSGFDTSRVAGSPQVYRWGAATQFLAFVLLEIFYLYQQPSISMIFATAYFVMSFAGLSGTVWWAASRVLSIDSQEARSQAKSISGG